MNDIVKAIENLDQRDWFDYFSAFFPLFLSLIAILIALDSTRRQNRATLFEKRYNNYAELLSFFTLWKMFVDQYTRIVKMDTGISIDAMYRLCVTFSVLGVEENDEMDILDYIKDSRLDRDEIKRVHLKLRTKNALTLEMTSFLYGGKSKKIEAFCIKYLHFQDRFEKVLNEQIPHEEFKNDVKAYKEDLINFYNLVFTYIKPRARIID